MRLGLPDKRTSAPAAARNGFVLIRPGGPRGGRAVVVAYAMAEDRTLVVQDVAETAGADAVLRVSQLLATRPSGLELLVRSEQARALGRIASYDLPLQFGPGDLAAIRGFVDGCARSGRSRSDARR